MGDPETNKAASALREGYYPGDLGFDPLNLKPEDPTEFRLMQEKELSHCRLAMIAAAGFLAQEAVTGETWGSYWGDASFKSHDDRETWLEGTRISVLKRTRHLKKHSASDV